MIKCKREISVFAVSHGSLPEIMRTERASEKLYQPIWKRAKPFIREKHPISDTPDDFAGDGNEGMFEFEKKIRL